MRARLEALLTEALEGLDARRLDRAAVAAAAARGAGTGIGATAAAIAFTARQSRVRYCGGRCGRRYVP